MTAKAHIYKKATKISRAKSKNLQNKNVNALFKGPLNFVGMTDTGAGQGGAISEGKIAYGCHALGDFYACQVGTPRERPFAYGSHSLGDF